MLSSCASFLGQPEVKQSYPARIIDKVKVYNEHYDNNYKWPMRIFGSFGNSHLRFGTAFALEEILASHNLLPRYRYLIHQENGKKIEISLPPHADWPIGKCVNVLIGKQSQRVSVIAAKNCNPEFIPPALR